MSDQLTIKLPEPILRSNLASASERRELAKRGNDNTIKVHPDKLIFRDGHNGRKKYSDEQIEEIADSMAEVGVLEDPSGDLQKNGNVIITTGHLRTLAIKLNHTRGIEGFDLVQIRLNPVSWSEVNRTIAMILENQKFKLDPLDDAEQIVRLMQMGLSQAEITKKIPGMNAMQVSLRVSLFNLTDEEKNLIRSEKISPTAAVQLSKEIPDADERIQLILEAAQSEEGKLKIKDIQKLKEAKDAAKIQPEPEADSQAQNPDEESAAPSFEEERNEHAAMLNPVKDDEPAPPHEKPVVNIENASRFAAKHELISSEMIEKEFGVKVIHAGQILEALDAAGIIKLSDKDYHKVLVDEESVEIALKPGYDPRAGKLDGSENHIEPGPDKSMQATSAKASELKQDPAIKSVDQPSQDDQKISSGRATAYDMLKEVQEMFVQLDNIVTDLGHPLAVTLIFDIDRKLNDIRAIVK